MGLWHDVRISVRILAKNRAFTLAALLTLALGIGSTTAIATIIHTILLRPLPYPDSDRIVQIISYRQEGAATVRASSMARQFILGLSERNRSFTDLGVFDSFSNVTRRRLTMTVDGHFGVAELHGTRISPVLLSILGAHPQLGRLFAPDDDRPERNRAIIIGDHSWRALYEGDRGVLGSSLTIDGRPYTLVGIMSPGFEFPDAQTDFWIPLTSAPVPPPSAPRSDSPNSAYADGIFARLRGGVSIEAARAEVEGILRQLDVERSAETRRTPEQIGFPRTLARRSEVMSMKDELVAPVRPMLQMLSFSTALLLVIACANLVGLFLERIESSRLEIAIRTALGATRRQILRQFVIEGIVLAVAGGAMGMAVASWMVQLTVLVVPPGTPRVGEISVHVPVLLIMTIASAAIGAFIGIVPAWQSTRIDQLGTLTRSEGGASARSGFRRVGSRTLIVVTEIAMAVVLCVGAGLLVRSFVRLVNVNPGYDARNVMMFQIVLPAGHATDPGRLYDDVLSRFDAHSAVEAVAATDVLPIVGASAFHLTLGGLHVALGSEPMIMRIVSRQYFQAMDMKIVEGRTFSEVRRAGYPELIVNQEFVRRYFAGTNPLGQIVGDPASRYEVIGVVNDVRHASLMASVQPEYYVDLNRFGLTEATRPYFVVRSSASPAVLGPLIRSVVRSVDPEAGVNVDQQTMAELVSASVAKPRFNTFLLGAFAIVALVLATVGIYGVVAHAVTQRTREIGIRMALGAAPLSVLAMILRQSVTLTSIGAAIGLLGATAVTRYLESMLFGLTPLDPPTFVAVALLFVLVALLASYVPAARASSIDPVVALRHD
jgi:putative ABC transport system permease protein